MKGALFVFLIQSSHSRVRSLKERRLLKLTLHLLKLGLSKGGALAMMKFINYKVCCGGVQLAKKREVLSMAWKATDRHLVRFCH